MEFTYRLPVRTGYEEVDIGGHHTYRNLETGLVLFEEFDRETDVEKIYDKGITLAKLDCQDYIIAGFDTDVLGRGNLHYTLDTIKQSDMKNTVERIKNTGANEVFWRDSSRVMYEVYTAEQFLLLYKEASIFMMMQKLYSDGLEQTLRNSYVNHTENSNSAEDMKKMRWGYELAAALQADIDTQLKGIFSLTDEEVENYKERFSTWIKKEEDFPV